jgi:L-asparaginase type I
MTLEVATFKVVVLMTGGTIAHQSKAGVAMMNFDPATLADALELGDVELAFKPLFTKGSMDIVPDDWRILAAAVAEAIGDRPRGIVILHGTDTMHYTAAALSFMVQNPGMPVVLTGSMRPGGDARSDALANLRDAIRVAAFADLGEVAVVFSADAERTSGVIIRGNRARKTNSLALNAFDSINQAPLGFVTGGEITLVRPPSRPRAGDATRIASELDENVALLKLTPATTPAILARQLEGLSGVVLEGTGVGHIKSDLQPVLAAFANPAVITTQVFYGGEHLGFYDADRAILSIPNVIPAGDMTSETALVKLMWSLKQGGDVRAIMQSNIAGEVAH